uniref:Uncharacterized protein n=1 Tax=Triticum urartu TaxID=4572 RepID=A0A8R7TIN7_TRIUA
MKRRHRRDGRTRAPPLTMHAPHQQGGRSPRESRSAAEESQIGSRAGGAHGIPAAAPYGRHDKISDEGLDRLQLA